VRLRFGQSWRHSAAANNIPIRPNCHGNCHGSRVIDQPATGDTTPTTTALTATSQPALVFRRKGGTLYAQPRSSTPATPSTNSGPTNSVKIARGHEAGSLRRMMNILWRGTPAGIPDCRAALPRFHRSMVTMAPPTPIPHPNKALPATTRPQQTMAVVLAARNEDVRPAPARRSTIPTMSRPAG
jgi:hypothetical protein